MTNSGGTLWAETALTPNGWQSGVRLDWDIGGRITAVTPDSPPAGEYCSIALPAASNLHSHAFQRAMAGLAEGRSGDGVDSFWTWRDLMYRILQHLTPDDVEAITALALIEMLEAGYASVGEFHYLHNMPDGTAYECISEMSDRIIETSAATGIGLTLLPVLYQQGGCDGRPLAGGQLRFANTPDSYLRLAESANARIKAAAPDYRTGYAPHSLRAVNPAALDQLITSAGGAPKHIHAAEQTAEIEEVEAYLGARPVQWLLDKFDIGPEWCLIHCTHMDEMETAGLAGSGAVAGLCPITEANLGDGCFPAGDYRNNHGRFGIGTDSNVRISLSDELRLLEYGQRLKTRTRAIHADPAKSCGRSLYEAAALGGAMAIGREAGRLAPGYFADIVTLNAGALEMQRRTGDLILDAFVFARGDEAISDVWSAGRHVVFGGRHIARDDVEARYRLAIGRLMEQL